MLNLKNPALLRSQSYINGQWVDADDGATVDVLNPSNGELVHTIASLGADETRRAIAAAKAAFPAWKKKNGKEVEQHRNQER